MPESDHPTISSTLGICDCHIHIYGPATRYPAAPTTPFPVPDAPLRAYRQVMRRLGIDRAVVVQPTAYAADNRCTMDAVREMGGIARGVVVVGADVSEGELAETGTARCDPH